MKSLINRETGRGGNIIEASTTLYLKLLALLKSGILPWKFLSRLVQRYYTLVSFSPCYLLLMSLRTFNEARITIAIASRSFSIPCSLRSLGQYLTRQVYEIFLNFTRAKNVANFCQREFLHSLVNSRPKCV